MVERCPDKTEVEGSIPSSPTNGQKISDRLRQAGKTDLPAGRQGSQVRFLRHPLIKIIMPKLTFWDRLAPVYDFLCAPFCRRDIPKIKELGEFKKSDRVLDLGGGTGRVAREINGIVHEVVVLDISLPMLKRAARRGLKIGRASCRERV